MQAALLQDLPGLTFNALCVLVQDLPDWQEILTYFRGSELQNYFTRILEDDLKAIIKPQYVDHIPKVTRPVGAQAGLFTARKSTSAPSGLLLSNCMHDE